MRTGALLFLVCVLPVMAQDPAWTAVLPKPDAEVWSPLTERERFKQFVRATFSPATVGGAAIAAGVSQARDRPEEWRQGLDGFGIRTGNNLINATIRDSLRYGLSAALREDNRYIVSGKRGVGGRIWYAVVSTYAARDSAGHMRFGVSKFAANAGTAALSRYWAPRSWQGLDNISQSFAITSAIQAGFNVGREFVPDLMRRVRR